MFRIIILMLLYFTNSYSEEKNIIVIQQPDKINYQVENGCNASQKTSTAQK